MLYANVDNSRTFLVQPQKGMTEAQAPASAYLHVLPYDNGLTIAHNSGKWYSCPTCTKMKSIPTDQHVGDVHLPPPSTVPKGSDLWKMELPGALGNLANEYEKRQVSLSGLFSTTLRKVTPTQSRHVLAKFTWDTGWIGGCQNTQQEAPERHPHFVGTEVVEREKPSIP